MKKHYQPSTWFLSIFAGGAVISAGYTAMSWIENLFYVMGPPPGDAAHAAFQSDVQLALLVLAGSAVLGLAVALSAAYPTRQATTARPVAANSAYWSERYRAEVRAGR